jgi:hypothetical protein
VTSLVGTLESSATERADRPAMLLDDTVLTGGDL